MRIYLYYLLFLIPALVSANTLNLSTGVSIFSKSLTGTHAISQAEGKLVSNGNLQYNVDLSYSLTGSMQFLASYFSRSVAFDNTLGIIAGDEKFDISGSSVGMKWIAFSSVAFRVLYTMDQDVAYKLNSSNKAVIDIERINFISIYYDQIVFLGQSMYSGYKLGYDIATSGVDVKDKTGYRVNLFVALGNLEASYELRNYTKNHTGNLDFVEKDALVNLNYKFVF